MQPNDPLNESKTEVVKSGSPGPSVNSEEPRILNIFMLLSICRIEIKSDHLLDKRTTNTFTDILI